MGRGEIYGDGNIAEQIGVIGFGDRGDVGVTA